MTYDEDIVLIAGPTASGKTSLAISIAQANDALILNADSMQVYRELRILTARPNEDESALAPHRLFGHRAGNEPYSVAEWLADVSPYLDGKTKLVIVGGTGLYFSSLLDGLSPMPEIDADIRDELRNSDAATEELYRELNRLDPKAAAGFEDGDRQRVVRALEVLRSTGKSILEWQSQKGQSIVPEGLTVKKLIKMPERSILHDRINQRFDRMIEDDALDEVEDLLALDYAETCSVMKAIGVPQLSAYLRDEITLDEAIERSKAASRQYAKRQTTWFRNTFDATWEVIG